MLKRFRALPTEARARGMLDRDYLWCLAQELLDQEEELDRLCPACRERAEENRCPGCGTPVGERVRESNPRFDWERFERMKRGGGDGDELSG